MEYDAILSVLPPYSVNTPSLNISLLHSFLSLKGLNIYTVDFSPGFYYNHLNDFLIENPFTFNVPIFPLLGYALWYFNSEDYFNIDKIGKYILKSLSPVHFDIYSPIFEKIRTKIPKFLKILRRYSEYLISIETNTYCFSINITNVIPTLEIIKNIKNVKPDSNVILGGPEVFQIYRCDLYTYLDTIDYVIYHNEGEIPLYLLLKTLKDDENPSKVPGISVKRNHDIYKTNPPRFVDINSIPKISYDQIIYFDFKFSDFNKLELLTTKGCPSHCLFCNEPNIWAQFVSKKPSILVDEIKYYIDKYNIRNFEITDNAFNNTNNLLKALETLQKEGYIINFGGNCKISNMSKETLKNYKDLGLKYCFLGIESASENILKLMRKNISLKYASDLIKMASKFDINVLIYLIIGFPQEYERDFELTCNFVSENKDYIEDICMSVFTLMNKSPIFYSNLLKPIQLGPKILNCFDYQTFDGIDHKIRAERLLRIKNLWASLKNH